MNLKSYLTEGVSSLPTLFVFFGQIGEVSPDRGSEPDARHSHIEAELVPSRVVGIGEWPLRFGLTPRDLRVSTRVSMRFPKSRG